MSQYTRIEFKQTIPATPGLAKQGTTKLPLAGAETIEGTPTRDGIAFLHDDVKGRPVKSTIPWSDIALATELVIDATAPAKK